MKPSSWDKQLGLASPRENAASQSDQTNNPSKHEVRNEVGLDVSHHTRISQRGREKFFSLTSFFRLCARICKNVHSTRLSGSVCFRSARLPNNTFSPEWPRNRGLAVEMALRNDGTSTITVLPALGAWKPAKDAGSHIPTATATAAVKLDATAKPAQ